MLNCIVQYEYDGSTTVSATFSGPTNLWQQFTFCMFTKFHFLRIMLPVLVQQYLHKHTVMQIFAKHNMMHLSNDLWTSGVKCLCSSAT